MAVWVTFFLSSLIAAPIPGPNEPHYLCKSRHYWEPAWCAGDFFLESPNAHTVFYFTVGSLTTVLSFTHAALVGRLLGTLVLAWGWTHWLSCLFFNRWSSLWTAWLFLWIASCGNFSGEWLVGGIEGKVFAYGFLFVALGDLLRVRDLRAAVWFGAAISFHPLVGLWGLLAVAGAVVASALGGVQWRGAATSVSTFPENVSAAVAPGTVNSRSHRRIFWVGWLVILLTVSLPGLIPVFQLLGERVPDDVRRAATYIQVYFRLAHHMDPMRFSERSYVGYGVLLAVIGCGMFWGGRTNPRRFVDSFVLSTAVFALGGLLVGWGPRPPEQMPYYDLRMNLLKFYPFRLADVVVPIGTCISLMSVLERTLLRNPASASSRRLSFVPQGTLLLLIYLIALWQSARSVDSNRFAHEDRNDWQDICQWAERNLPQDALVQTPTNGWTFKWFGQRAEYVNFKDCPQDAAGIVEWNQRLNFLNQWYQETYTDQFYSAVELQQLRRDTGLTHLLTDRLGPLALEPVYRNGTFQIYDLRQTDERLPDRHQ